MSWWKEIVVKGRRLCSSLAVPAVIAVLASIVLTAVPARAAITEVLRFRVTEGANGGGRMYDYWKFSNASRTIQAGDYIEYDVYLHFNAQPGVGGIDIYNTDGTHWRDEANWKDQNNVSGHPASDLRTYADRQWYHRKLAVPTTMVGRTISYWDLAVDGTYGYYDVPAAMYDNVCVTHNNSVVLWAWQDNQGMPSLLTRDIYTPATVQADAMIPTQLRRGPGQVGTDFFWWYDYTRNDNVAQMPYHPHGLSSTGVWDGYGYGYNGFSGHYETYNQGWWEGELQDLKAAGIDFISMVCWGNQPNNDYFWIARLTDCMVPALDRCGSDIKIALFDDTSSECMQWNYDSGRGYSSTPKMDLSNSGLWSYFYDGKIKLFFNAVPKKYWVTHNGLPLEQGGRPVIVVYNDSLYTNVNGYAGTMWNAIKSSFARDFKDANGVGIVPWIVQEYSWYRDDPTYRASADTYYTWGAACNGPTVGQVNGYYTAEIGPGYNDSYVRYPYAIQPRSNDGMLVSWFNNTGTLCGRQIWDCNLILMETWNELWEGSAIDRCVDYPNIYGGSLPETFYMDAWDKKCITSSMGRREWDATFLQTFKIPTTLTRGTTQLSIKVRNDGLDPWDPNATNPTRIGIYLEDANGNLIANSSVRATLSSIVRHGDTATVTWAVPNTSIWNMAAGNYNMRLDMVDEWAFWFSSQGDTPVKIPVTVN